MKKEIIARIEKTRLTLQYRDDPCIIHPGWLIQEDDDARFPVCIVNETKGGVKDKNGRSPYQAARAHRIVAAINACAGIPTEALEQGVVLELVDALRSAAGVMEDFIKDNHGTDWVHDHLEHANTILAKARGQS